MSNVDQFPSPQRPLVKQIFNRLRQVETSTAEPDRYVGVTAANYSVQPGENIIGVRATDRTAVTITLPPAAVVKRSVRIVDEGGNAAANNITIRGRKGALIGGVTELVLAADRDFVELTPIAPNWMET